MDVNEDEYNIIKPSLDDNELKVYVYVLKDLDLERTKYLMDYKNKSNYTKGCIKINERLLKAKNEKE